MNFLLRHSFSSSDLCTSNDLDKEGRGAIESGHGSPFFSPLFSDSSTGDDGRASGGGGGGGEFWRSRNRMVIEEHSDVADSEGGIFVLSGELPENWHLLEDVASLAPLDRTFVFPGEQLYIVVYVFSHGLSVPEILTPFQVAARMNTDAMQQHLSDIETEGSNVSAHLIKNTNDPDSNEVLVDAKIRELTLGRIDLPVSESLKMESHKKKSTLVLESFQNSHFFTRIAGADEPLWQKRSALDQHSGSSKVAAEQLQYKKSSQTSGALPLLLEKELFDPKVAGGVARNAVASHAFPNGDIAVLLKISVATDLTDNAVLEVLQFERPKKSGCVSVTDLSLESSSNNSHNASQHLLHWLLPLDRPSSPPPPPVSSASGSIFNNSHQRNPSGSSLFSFGHSRSSSLGSSSQNNQSWLSSPGSYSTSNYGPEDWDRLTMQKMHKGKDVGSEGLLSFRGAQLEPQRFSVHCGLEGLYIPGKRWRKNVDIVQPIAVESYFADCNTKDLICVLIENTVPSHLPDVVFTVDSISIVCQSASPNCLSLPLSIACVEVGENHKLPGLLLRVGEQHSFILKPDCPAWKPPILETEKAFPSNTFTSREEQSAHGNSIFGEMKETMYGVDDLEQDSRSYALIISCRCNRAGSRLVFQHPMQWQPRTPRDILLSVCVEPCTVPVMPNGTLPQLLSQVLTVEATNLTAESMNLILLAPSSKNSTTYMPSSVSVQSTPLNSFVSFHEKNDRLAKDTEENIRQDENKYSGLLQRSMSLPPAKPIESIMGMSPIVVKEKTISAADIAAEQNSSQTHLWLQSTVPLGCVPARSTTSIRCELLPLTDGIISLDTLHISKKEEDLLYIPERPLQIYCTSGIANRLS